VPLTPADPPEFLEAIRGVTRPAPGRHPQSYPGGLPEKCPDNSPSCRGRIWSGKRDLKIYDG
jgi:hypothetical protein